MALNRQFLQLMTWLKEKGHLGSGRKVVEIGAQQLNDAFLEGKDELDRLCRLYGVAPPSLPPPLAKHVSRKLDAEAPHARGFYEALGYDYAYVDIDAPGGYPRDLNFDSVPAHLAGQHHLVTNFGTTEHVANQLNAFKIIHDLTAVGGLMIHELPAQGDVNHGFFSYQPRFFDRLAYSNEYDMLFFDFRWYEMEYGIPEDVHRLTNRFVETHNRPRFGGSQSAIATVLRKTTDAPFVPPMDVPYGTNAPDRQFEDRYGIVFARPSLFSLAYLRKALRRLRRALRD